MVQSYTCIADAYQECDTAYSDAYPHINGNVHAASSGDGYGYSYADTNIDSHADTNRWPNHYAYTNQHSYIDASSIANDSHPDGYPHAGRSFDSYTNPAGK